MTPAALALLGVFGLIIGSFLNVCIGRIPAGESVASPGSRCPSCRTPIAWYDNVPVLSYLILRGRCRACRVTISARYPIVELVTAAAFVLQGTAIGEDWPMLVSRLIFTSLLIVLFGTDFDTQRLPNVLTYPGIVVGLIGSVWLPPGVVECVIGAALGAGLLLTIRAIWYRVRGVEALGLGDVKMLAMIGAFLGWRQILVVLFLSVLAGSVIGGAATVVGNRTLQTRMAFGTFLAVAAFVASICGTSLIDWYVAVSGI